MPYFSMTFILKCAYHHVQCKNAISGVCLGMQLAVCEFARNVLGWEGKLYERFSVSVSHQFLFILCQISFMLCLCTDANSTEFDPDTKYPVVSNLLINIF